MKLVINADDAGVDCSRNRGIFKAVDEGVVTSTSVIVGQGGWEDLFKILASKKRNVSLGLHLNLTAGKPLAKNCKSLVNSDENFYNKFDLFKRSQDGLLNKKEVEVEFRAQIKMFDRIGTPTHIDGHNHIHLLPGAGEVLPKVFPKGTMIRLPIESPHLGVDPKEFEVMEIYNNVESLIAVTNFLCARAKEIWKDHFRYVDDFGGTRIADHPTLEAFQNAVNRLEGDICELMCHPGDIPDEASVRFSKFPQRQEELRILTSLEFKEFLYQKNAGLHSYKSLAMDKKTYDPV